MKKKITLKKRKLADLNPKDLSDIAGGTGFASDDGTCDDTCPPTCPETCMDTCETTCDTCVATCIDNTCTCCC